jgi:RNA polymerase sigma-70 factor, ECF subfamily
MTAGASLVTALRPNVVPDTSGARKATASPRTRFDALVREHESALRAFALRLAGSATDANDLVQDSLERAFRHLDTFTPGTNGRAWFFAILHRAFIDRCRRRAVEKRSDCIEDVDVATPEPTEPPVWTSVTAEQFARAIDQLPEEFRSVYRLHAEDRSYQEISAALGIPINTVGTRLSRARSKLRALLVEALGLEGTP